MAMLQEEHKRMTKTDQRVKEIRHLIHQVGTSLRGRNIAEDEGSPVYYGVTRHELQNYLKLLSLMHKVPQWRLKETKEIEETPQNIAWRFQCVLTQAIADRVTKYDRRIIGHASDEELGTIIHHAFFYHIDASDEQLSCFKGWVDEEIRGKDAAVTSEDKRRRKRMFMNHIEAAKNTAPELTLEAALNT